MPFIETSMEEPEVKLLPEAEYELRTTSASIKGIKKDNPDGSRKRLNVGLASTEYPEAETIWWGVNLPHPRSSDQANKMSQRQLVAFFKLFGIPYEMTGWASEDITGHTARVLVTVGTDQDGAAVNELKFRF